MLRVVLAFAVWFAAGHPAAADEAADIRGVIDRQIAAFAASDLAAAFGFASPMIQQMFGDPETFGRMVITGYPMIWRPTSIRHLGLRDDHGRVLHRMAFGDAAGRVHLFDYEMVEGPDGWRINGVHPVPVTDTGV